MNHLITKNYQLKYNLKQLQAFLEVAKTMSFRKAAENLFISQPAISRKISQLEEALNCQLFCRSKTGIKLTNEGELLREQLPKLFENLFEITGSLKEPPQSKTIKLGYTCAAISGFLPALLNETEHDLKDYEMIFSEGFSSTLIDEVLNKNLDGAFIMERPRHENLVTIDIRSEPMGIMIPENHSLNIHNEISLEQIKNEKLVIFPREQNPTLYNHIFDCMWNVAGFYPTAIREADSCNATFGFVTSGMGVAFVAESMSNLCTKGTVYKSIVGLRPKIEFSFITHKSNKNMWQKCIENSIYNSFCEQDCQNCHQFKKLTSAQCGFSN